LHDEKQPSPRNSTEAGREIDLNDEQEENAFASIRISFDPDSNVNDESELHDEKQPSPRNSTEAGREIDLNDEQEERAYASIRIRLDADSNISDLSGREQKL
jgi:hypothetical protein